MLRVETEIFKKGAKVTIDTGETFTCKNDSFCVTVIDEGKIISKRVFADPIFAGEAVIALEAFYTHLKSRTNV